MVESSGETDYDAFVNDAGFDIKEEQEFLDYLIGRCIKTSDLTYQELTDLYIRMVQEAE